MSELPEGWEWSTLADVARWGSGGTPKKGVPGYYDGPIPWAVIGDLNDGVVTECSNSITNLGLSESSAKLVDEGSILIAMYGSIGKLGIAGVPMATNQAIAFARPYDGLDPIYLFNFLLSQRDALNSEGKGATQLNISQTILKAWPIPIPPLPEQRRIVAAIEEHFSRLDAAEESLSNATRRTEAFVASNVNLAFDHLDERMPLGELAAVNGGIQKQPKRRPTMNKFPFLRVANVKRNQLELDDVHEIELFGDEIDRYRLEKGDLLVVEGNGSPEQIGRSAVWEGDIDDCVHQNHLIRVRPGSDLEPRFLNMFWNSSVNARQLASVASSTSGLYTLSTSKLKRVEIPVTSRSDQLRIADELDAVFELANRILGELASAQRRSSALRRAILTAAFSGRLVPQDSSDEPASVLLEGIAAERAATKPSRRKKKAKS